MDGVDYGVRTGIFDLHGQAQVRGFDFRALFARASLDDTSMLNQVLGLEGKSGVGEKMQAATCSSATTCCPRRRAPAAWGSRRICGTRRWIPTRRVAAGFTRNPSKNNTYTTFGIELKPIPNIVVKVDHMWVNNAADSGVNQFTSNWATRSDGLRTTV